MIGIVDYGMSNVRSVMNAVREVGCDPVLISQPDDLAEATHAVVPGVGQFAAAMRRLNETGMTEAVRSFAAEGKPLLGICLGMQLLAATGTEGGETGGFALVAGTVQRLPDETLPVPHIGWNSVRFLRKHPVVDGVKDSRDFYFVHSYVMRCGRSGDALGSTDYGQEFTSVVARDNVVGFQFHPEKSQANGLQLLENFCRWDGAC